MTSLLIGCGNLGRIILNEFIKKEKVIVLEKDSKARNLIKKNYKKVKIIKNIREVRWSSIKYLMLCIKPKDAIKVLSDIKKHCTKKTIIISFVAGLKTQTVSEKIDYKSNVVRIMPNIFISFKKSATGVFSKNLEKKIKTHINIDFGCFGNLVWIKKEQELDFFTALFGGAPAYIFYILYCFDKIIRKNGFNKKESSKLLISLVEGTHLQLNSQEFSFKQTLDKVASKGGTTEEALKVLSQNDALYKMLEKAINSAKQKSQKISFEIN